MPKPAKLAAKSAKAAKPAKTDAKAAPKAKPAKKAAPKGDAKPAPKPKAVKKAPKPKKVDEDIEEEDTEMALAGKKRKPAKEAEPEESAAAKPAGTPVKKARVDIETACRAFVSGISVKTTRDQFTEHFNKCEGFVNAYLFELHGKPTGRGLVNFTSSENMQAAVAKMNGTELNGAELAVVHCKPAESKINEARNKLDPRKSFFVKGIPVEKSEEEVNAYFSTCEGFKATKMMLDFEKNFKGSAIVEFETEENMEAAKTKLQGTPFSGAELTFEAAKETVKHKKGARKH